MIGQGRVYIDVMDNSAILFKAIGYKNNKNRYLLPGVASGFSVESAEGSPVHAHFDTPLMEE